MWNFHVSNSTSKISIQQRNPFEYLYWETIKGDIDGGRVPHSQQITSSMVKHSERQYLKIISNPWNFSAAEQVSVDCTHRHVIMHCQAILSSCHGFMFGF